VPPGEDHTKSHEPPTTKYASPFFFLNRNEREDREDDAKYFLTYSIISFAKTFACFALFAVQNNGWPKPSIPRAIEIRVDLV
jgi:hypothetical protein